MTLVFPRCILTPTGLLVSWMSCIIFCSSVVDFAISTMSSAKMRWDRYSPSILIPLSFQLILPMIASCRHDVKSLSEMLLLLILPMITSCRHDVKSLSEMLSPCLTPLCSLNFLLSVCRQITDVASWYRCFIISRYPCQLHGSWEHGRLAHTQCYKKLSHSPQMQSTVGCCTPVVFLGVGW